LKQRSFTYLVSTFILALIVILPGCGGGSKNSTAVNNTVSTLTVSPSALSMDFGQVVQLSGTPKNSDGVAVLQTVTYKVDNPAVVQVSNSGNVCAGSWDTNFIVCTPATTAGTATITATSGGVNATVAVSTHPKLASVQVTTTGVACTSTTKTQQFSVKAFSSTGADITSQVGTVNWISSDVNLVTIDASGLASAKKPGRSNITALINNVISIPVAMIVCPPATITIKEKDSSPAVTAFTIDAATTKTLEAVVVDTLGQTIASTDITLQWSTSQASVATVTSAGVITAVSPGKAGVIASCTPPNCNPGTTAPVYSNLASVSVNGTSAPTVYATGKTATTIVPIDAAGTVGTALNIPTVTVNSVAVNPVINSFVFNYDGNQAFLGSDQGMITLQATTGAVSINTNLVGKVLAVSPDSNWVVIGGTNTAFVWSVLNNNSNTLAIPGATAASWSPDSVKVFITAGNTVYDYSPVFGLRSFPVASAVNDVNVITQGSYAYFAGDVGNTLSARANCNNAALSSLATANKPVFVESSFDSTHVFATEGTNMYDVSLTTGTAPCPPPNPVQALTTTAYAAAVTPNQLIVLPDISKTYLTNPTPALQVYGPTSGASTVNLAAGSTGSTTGGATMDSKSVYVGATGLNNVQKIDTASGTVTQFAVNLKDKAAATVAPDFVVVRPK
jgi:trimeric autotransporter adhesin